MTVSETKRLDWVDVSKGITILLMVAGHTSIPEPISKYIWSFHMPLFFFVSGVFYSEKKYNTFSSLFKRRIFTLLVPYVFFSVVVMLGYYGTVYWNPKELYLGWSGYALWFIPVLFMSEMLLYPFAKFMNKTITKIIIIVLLLCLSKLLAMLEIHLPFKIEAVPLSCSFLFMGYVLKEITKKYLSSIWLILIAFLISVVLSQILPKTDVARNEIGWMFPNYINAIVGIFFVMQLSRLLLSYFNLNLINRFLLWSGRNTLFILAFSQLFNYWILVALDMVKCPHIIGLLLRYVFLFISIYVASEVLNRYFPCIVGKIKDK